MAEPSIAQSDKILTEEQKAKLVHLLEALHVEMDNAGVREFTVKDSRAKEGSLTTVKAKTTLTPDQQQVLGPRIDALHVAMDNLGIRTLDTKDSKGKFDSIVKSSRG